MKQKRLVSKNGDVIYPDDSLINDSNAYRIDKNIIIVSPAIFELLHDNEVKHIVMKQVKLIDIRTVLQEIISEQFSLYETEPIQTT